MNIGLRMNLPIGTEQELLLLERDEQFDRQSDQLASLIGVRPESRQGGARFIAVDDPNALTF